MRNIGRFIVVALAVASATGCVVSKSKYDRSLGVLSKYQAERLQTEADRDNAVAKLQGMLDEQSGVLAKTKADFAHTGRVVGGAPAGPAGFDSLAVLANGNICVATLTTGKITEFAPDGKIVREVKMPDVYPTNICFGGPDMRTAYITLSDKGQLGVMQWPTPGLKLNYN